MNSKKQFHIIKNRKIVPIAFIISILLATVVTISGMLYYKTKIKDIGLEKVNDYTNYKSHYVLIVDDSENSFWDSVYEGAKEKGKKLDIYVEKFGSNLQLGYSTNDLLEMAIAADVDGIIVQADSDKDTMELINRAEEAGIPVTTVLEDAPESNRVSFVGVSGYQLGIEYGNQILDAAVKTTKNVTVLYDSNTNHETLDIILTGMKDTLKGCDIEVQVQTVDWQSTFGPEEAVYDAIINNENEPDILVCLNSTDTICAYQAVVDYNKVGEVNIIGYYDSVNIRSAIEKQIIYSSIVIDTEQMGAYSVEALHEYARTKWVSKYVAVDTDIISIDNVKNIK